MREMDKNNLIDWKTAQTAITFLMVVLFFLKLNSTYIVLGGALLGAII